MSIAAVVHRHVFGLKADVKDNVCYLDEQTIFYPAGANSILYNVETKTQKFIPVSEKCEGLTAIAVSANKRYVVTAERSEKAQAAIYDLHSLRKRKTLTASDCDAKEFVSLSFSTDAKYIVTQTGGPDWMLYYWTWEKTKLMASVKTTNAQNGAVYQIAFNPADNTQLCVVGNGIFKLFRYSEGQLKQFASQKLEPKNFLCHAWVAEDRIAVGTEDGRLLVFENGEVKMDILNVHGPQHTPRAIHTMLSFSKGLVVAGAGGSAVIYEKGDGQELFKKTREFSFPEENIKISNMAISPSEDSLVCSSENAQIFTLLMASAETKGDEAKFELLSQPFHHGQITGMDTCIRKPLICTCSADRSVRVWNYVENSSELVKYFPEEAYSVAIHPSGLYILVGFSDKLRLMNLLIDDIRPYREFTIRGCRECRFSNGGQYFAAVHGNTIQIYSTWTFDNIGNLKGHNGKVRSLYWTQDDSKIISAGMDGALYDWTVKDLKREGENILKSCSYTSAVCTPDGKTIYAVGSDKLLKEVIDSQVVREIDSNTVLTQVVLSHSGRMMFVATSMGTIRSMKFPLSNEPGEYQEHQGHSAPITKLRVSYDDQFLFSVSEDGCMYVFKISDKEGHRMKRERELAYADEILVTKSDLEEKTSLMAELKTRVEELKMENEYQLRLKDMNFNEKIKEITEKFMQEIEALKITSTVLRTDKEKDEVRHEEEMAEERDRHAKELLENETVHNAKLMAEYEKYQELQTRTADLQQQWEKQMRDMDAHKEKALAELSAHFESKLREKQAEIDQLQEEMRQQFREFEETTRETEEDADSEIVDMKHRYERKLKEEREIGLRLKGENGIMKKKFNTLQNEIEAHKGEIQKMFLEERKLHGVIKSLEKDIAGLKKEIQERDETIQDKEKRIYDLKKKNQELEKFKFVLDYKIKELKRQIEPRENDIAGMTHQIQEMDTELEQYHKSNASLELTINDLRSKLKAAESEVEKERERVKQCAAVVKRFRVDLNECVAFIQEPKLLKTSLKNLYHKYCKTDRVKENAMETDVQMEYNRQREYLERTVASLRKKVSKDVSTHRADNVHIMQENVSLIKEINQLRKDLRGARQKEKAIEKAQQEIARLASASPTGATPPQPATTFALPSLAV